MKTANLTSVTIAALLGIVMLAGAGCTNSKTNQETSDNMETLNLTQEWDKKFPQSDKVNHRKVTFKNRYGITLAADLYEPKNVEGKLAAIAVSGPFGAVKEQASGLYAQTMAQSVRKEKKGTRIITELRFPENEKVDKRVYPERIQVNCFTTKNGKRSEVALTIYGKPAVRLPESYWLSFTVPGIESVIAEKMGERVNLMDVVEKGNRQMHGIDRYVDLITSGETIRISSKEAFLLNVGEAQGLNYSTNYPDKRKGVHFNLNNNLWGTNFSMWNEGSLTYHFVIETLSRK